jgi:hypothetical protein
MNCTAPSPDELRARKALEAASDPSGEAQLPSQDKAAPEAAQKPAKGKK